MNKILGGCLAASVIGNIMFALSGNSDVVQKETSKPVSVDKVVVSKDMTTDDKEWKLMKAKIASLMSSLSEKNDQIDQLLAKQQDTVNKKSEPRMSHSDRMEKLKIENPDEYKKIQDRMNSMRDRIAKGTASRSEFFNGLDSSRLDEKQQESLKALQEKMVRIDELNKKLADATPEEQSELRGEFFAEMRGTRELMDSARNTALDNLAQDIGYEGEEATQFREYLDYVNEMTSLRSMFGGKGGGGRPR